MQLIFLHFAGGNCYSYDFLKQHLKTAFTVHALELPGRGKRLGEPCITSKRHAVNDYVRQLKEILNGEPYIIFGHSMGATLGLSVVWEIEQTGLAPSLFIPSGNAGPRVTQAVRLDEKEIYKMNDEDFKKELRRLGGISEEILDNDEAYYFFSRIIRADFQILETDENFEESIRINTPIYALMGSDEKRSSEIENWKRFTSGSFQYKIFSGNHFFIHRYPQELAATLKSHKALGPSSVNGLYTISLLPRQ